MYSSLRSKRWNKELLLTWFSDSMPMVWSKLLTIFCQCILDPCCFVMICEWMVLDDPFTGLILAALGACLINTFLYMNLCFVKGVGYWSFGIDKLLTCIHKLRKGLISFFNPSRIIPNIFSTQAVKCCLNNKAGYLATILDFAIGFPSIPL